MLLFKSIYPSSVLSIYAKKYHEEPADPGIIFKSKPKLVKISKNATVIIDESLLEFCGENAAIKYVIGSMAAVSQESTKVSKDEGERVASTLIDMLKTSGINAEAKMQGSVALDIHIEGHSDVDMLILKSDVITFQGPALPGTYYSDSSDTRPMVDTVRELRLQAEAKLKKKYHEFFKEFRR